MALEPTGDAEYDELQRRLGLQAEEEGTGAAGSDEPPHDPPSDEDADDDTPDPESEGDPDSDES